MKPLWKNRNYMLLWGGQGISWLGTEISGIAMPLIILTLTGSPALAGAIGAMRGITYVLLAIPAGYVLDRWNRRNIMIVGNLGSGLAMLSVSVGLLLKHLSVPNLFILMGIEGGCFVFANIGRFSARRFLVSDRGWRHIAGGRSSFKAGNAAAQNTRQFRVRRHHRSDRRNAARRSLSYAVRRAVL